MPKRTKTDLIKVHGITRDQLNAAQSKGVNIWNDDELSEHLGNTRHRIQSGASINDPESASAQSLEEIENAIRCAQDIDTVKILKEKVMALKGVVAVQVEMRELVSAAEVREEIVKCVSVTRSALMKLTSDLPPKLAGLTESQIQKILVKEIRDMLLELSSDSEALFNAAEK